MADFADAHLPEMFESKASFPFKAAYSEYQEFCFRERIKQPSKKKDFRSELESEGYVIENSRKHANQLRIYENELRF